MNLKVKFHSLWAPSLGVLIVLLVPGAGRTQLSDDSELASRVASPPARYRDGDAWVEMERVGPRGALPQAVVAWRGRLRFSAEISRAAIVQLAPSVPDVEALFARLRLERPARLSVRARIYRVEGGAGEDGLDLAVRLARVPGLVSATPDLLLRHRAAGFEIPPNDEHYRAQWYLPQLGMESAWRIASGDPEVKVAVIDSGCDMQHPDLRDAFVDSADLVDLDQDPSYEPGAKGNEHGTACAGIVGAVGNNSIGIVGVCPQCRLMCVRLFAEHNALVALSADIGAFDAVLEAGASVVSNSWGFGDAMPVPAPLRAMIETVLAEGRGGLGAVVVFAAGNENRAIEPEELAAIPGVINVGAVTNFEEAAPFSNFGPSIALTAPTATFTTDIAGPEGESAGDYTALFGGTSSACPVVAGVAALMVSADKSVRGARIAELLAATASPALYARPDSLGHDPLYGYGLLAPAAALRALLGLPEPAPEPDAGTRPDAGAAMQVHSDAGCSVGVLGRSRGRAGCGLAACVIALGVVWLSRRRCVR